jgi:hypothetical protein
MTTKRRLAGIVIISFMSGVFGSLIAVRPAHAQSAVSTFTIQVTGTAPAAKTGLSEAVTFAGPVRVTASVENDPALGPRVIVAIDGRGMKGTGNKSGTIYLNECEADLTRPFVAKDVIHLTFAFFEDAPGSYMKSKTALLTLTLTYNIMTMKLAKVNGSAGSL